MPLLNTGAGSAATALRAGVSSGVRPDSGVMPLAKLSPARRPEGRAPMSLPNPAWLVMVQ